MSSLDVLHTCFPTLMELLRAEHFALLHGHLFPSFVQETCPTPAYYVQQLDVVVLWPALVPLCTVGFLVGLTGTAACRGESAQRRLWSYAFLFFGLMNFFAVFGHCLAGFAYKTLFISLDIICTSTSSLCLLLVAWLRLACKDDTQFTPERWVGGYFCVASIVQVRSIGCCTCG